MARIRHHPILPPWPLLVLVFPLASQDGPDYWQQQVDYDIRVTLDDSLHTLRGYEKITYSNHSPDTLTYLWFHLWPNAYRNRTTAFAKQKLKSRSTEFYFADEKDRGYIDSLEFTAGGQALHWETHPEWIDVARVNLSSPLAPGETTVLETPFFVKLPKVFSRLGHTGKHYEITQWYPKPAVYDREGWHPMPYLDQGEFYSEFGTFDVTITLPKEYRVMATGMLVDGDDEYAWLDSLAAEGDSLHALDKRAFKKRIKQLQKSARKRRKTSGDSPSSGVPLKTLHFHQENVHDFAWFADPNWIVRKGELWLADSTHRVTLWSMYLPKNAKLWARSIEYIHDAGYWYSRFFGEYPYDHITAVDGDMSAGGGMEYPNITVISSGGSEDLLEFVIMHEVGHNWFYGILGSNERDHAWMDEGLNEYANIRYWEKKYPDRNGAVIISDMVQSKLGIARHLDFRWVMGYLGYQVRALPGDDQPIKLTSQDFHPANYGSIVYGKTGIFTRFLQHYLGEEKMDEIFQHYTHDWKFKHPGPETFRSYFDEHVDEDLGWYLDDAFESTREIDYAVVSFDDNRATLANYGSLVCPVEVAFFSREGGELERRWIRGFSGETVISVPRDAQRVVIDPDNYMPDVRRSNNSSSRPLKFNFVFDQPAFHRLDVNLVPWLNWNSYNGITPGIMAYSGYIPGHRYGLSVSPQWDFRHSRVVGKVSGKRILYQTLGFRSLTLSASIKDYSGRRGVKLETQGLIRKPVVSTPSVILGGAYFFHRIRPDVIDTSYYDPGDHHIISLDFGFSHKPDPFRSYSAGTGLVAGFSGDSFARVHFEGEFQWRYLKKLTAKVRGWMGGFVLARSIPAQYRIWMSGSLDPDFENPVVFNRTDNQEGPFNVYAEQFVQGGPSLKGRIEAFSTDLAWAVNLEHTLPHVPVSIFGDAGGATDLEELLFDAGLSVSAGPVGLILPLYQSWDVPASADGVDWLTSRIRYQISLPF